MRLRKPAPGRFQGPEAPRAVRSRRVMALSVAVPFNSRSKVQGHAEEIAVHTLEHCLLVLALSKCDVEEANELTGGSPLIAPWA